MKHDIKKSWDLAFSAPSSVKESMSEIDDQIRSHINEAHKKAVESAVRFIKQKEAHSKKDSI